MGFRFRRSIRLFPGVRINLSGSGPSLSVGRRGMSLNVGRRGARVTTGIPGTGISYSESLGGSSTEAREAGGPEGETPSANTNGCLRPLMTFVVLAWGLILVAVLVGKLSR